MSIELKFIIDMIFLLILIVGFIFYIPIIIKVINEVIIDFRECKRFSIIIAFFTLCLVITESIIGIGIIYYIQKLFG